MKYIKVLIMLLCFATNFIFLYFENQLTVMSLVLAFVFYFIASAIHLVSHECGHLTGGLLTKYKLLLLQIGPCNIIIKNGKPSFLWQKMHGGQCIMYPVHGDKKRYKAYNLGGAIANITISLLSFLLLYTNNFYFSLMFIELVFVGLQKALVNLVPHKSNSIPNDGYIVKLLCNNQAVQHDYSIYLKLYADLFLKNPISINDYIYERENAEDSDELLYYNEIQKMLQTYNSSAV